jgi:hypothetical protein
MGIWKDAWTYKPHPNTKDSYLRKRNLISFLYKSLIFLFLAIALISYTIAYTSYFSIFQYLKNYNTEFYYLVIGAILGWAFALVSYTIYDQMDSPESRLYVSFRGLLFYFAVFIILQGLFQLVIWIF